MANVNLNKTVGTYSNCISEHIQELNKMFEDKNVSLEDYRKIILDTVAPANDTTAKRKFILGVKQAKTKTNLVFHINNVILRANHMGTNMYDRWANEQK